MAAEKYGDLVPVEGGDPIPLVRKFMTVGRRETCDICLNFKNISSNHCELEFQHGYWCVRDLASANGTKVKGARIAANLWKPLQPGEEIKFASHAFTIEYAILNRKAFDEAVDNGDDVFGQSLLEKAGIEKPKKK